MELPDIIENEQQLEEILTRPSEALIESVRGFSGAIAVLGIGGKTGFTVGVRLRRALDAAGCSARVIGISRFSDPEAQKAVEAAGLETVAADLLDPEQVATLPDADKVIYLAGLKFGTTGNEAATWAMNTLPPEFVCRRYAGKPIVAYSTGAVYDMVPVNSGGATEDHPLEPRGEYANASVGRERVFEWASSRFNTPICQIRLFYANDLRYGVIRDIAESVQSGTPIDVSMGVVSLIWQGDAADQSLRAFSCATTPPTALNITGPEVVSIQKLAQRLGTLLGKEPVIIGEPANDALFANTSRAAGLFGYPEVPLDTMIRWTAAWVAAGGRGLGKPTHWEVRDGRY
jgi:nucleoside-diphosphate-sugar epimerase